MPGSGKSTAALALAGALGSRAPQLRTAVLGMDGWHYSRAELDRFPDSEAAHERRGAPFTFDTAAFADALERCRARGGGGVSLPFFDHALKDPVAGGVRIAADTDVVIVEGNYLALGGEWGRVRECLDCLVYLDVDIDTAMERVRKRHMSEMGLSANEARFRVENNDRLNAELVACSSVFADVKIASD